MQSGWLFCCWPRFRFIHTLLYSLHDKCIDYKVIYDSLSMNTRQLITDYCLADECNFVLINQLVDLCIALYIKENMTICFLQLINSESVIKTDSYLLLSVCAIRK